MYNLSYCSVVLFFGLCLKLAVLNANSTNENSNQNTIYKGNGSLTIPLETGLYMYIYEFKAEERSSIFGFSLTATPSNNITEEDIDPSAKVIINVQNAGNSSYVTATSWTLTPRQRTKNYSFSRKHIARVTFMPQGNWSGNEVVLTYSEIIFESTERSSSKNGTTVTPWDPVHGRSYRPNSVYTYRIVATKDMNVSNVIVILYDLDIDEDVGEYLLIGAGRTPFEGPPPLFIASFFEPKKYLINDENAYIVFVSGSTRKNHRGFNITWYYSGTKFIKEKKKDNEDVLESVPICIYNTTAAMEELKKNKNRFESFREKFALIATEYAKKKKENSFLPGIEIINPSSVSVFRVSGKISVNDTTEALYAMVKISQESNEGKAVFKWYELESIVEKYTERFSETGEDIFQFGKCPYRIVPEQWGKTLGLYLIAPVVLCLLLLLFTWRLNPVTEYIEKKKRIHRASQQISKTYYEDGSAPELKPIENAYDTLPKVVITNIHGRRSTLNLSHALLDVYQSEDETFNKMSMQRRSNIVDYPRDSSTRTPFSTKHPEINQAFTLDDECESQDSLGGLRAEQQEDKSEHMYDTVKSKSKFWEIITEETKL